MIIEYFKDDQERKTFSAPFYLRYLYGQMQTNLVGCKSTYLGGFAPIAQERKGKMEVQEFQYKFGDLVMVGRKPANRHRTVWYIECEHCKGRHVFKKQGTKIWHTSCWYSRIEWTITPGEYYVQKPADFTKIMGDV